MNDFLNQPIDVAADFHRFEDEYYLPGSYTFDENQLVGEIQWEKYRYDLEWAFNKIGKKLVRGNGKETPQRDYEVDPFHAWKLSFITDRTVRLELFTGAEKGGNDNESVMLVAPIGSACWEQVSEERSISFNSKHGSVSFARDRWKLAIYDASSVELFHSIGLDNQRGLHQKFTPFGYKRSSLDYSRSMVASFSSAYDERIYGCGESFTSLNKMGQRMQLCASDAQSALTQEMYKPVPFFLSDQGYGMFVHASTPMTFDFGHTYQSVNSLYVGDNKLDLFIFLGSPKEILEEYTNLTGRSPVPPVWSLGLWMSELGYESQEEVEDVAEKLRDHEIPCDVLHIDAKWFMRDFNCDYVFSKLFPAPSKMIGKLSKMGFWISLWQLPYYTRKNDLFHEVIDRDLLVKDGNGEVPTEDVIVDFTNSNATEWITEKIRLLLDLGVACIKADFGEAAPFNGNFSNGRSGFFEHNLYPLRYTKAIYELLQSHSSDTVIWARSSWAGGQRYPIHWSGDPEVDPNAMASTLKGGLSLGLSGFTCWSHDIGGFSGPPEPELFLRWAFFGLLSSHSRVHGLPPRKPWLLGEEVLHEFRRLVLLRYSLLPYIYSQLFSSGERGLPLLRPLFLEFENDKTCWFIEDQYLLGESLLVAPLFAGGTRMVYLPKGSDWYNYESSKFYKGGSWVEAVPEVLPGCLFVKSDTLLPHIQPASCTRDLDWTHLELTAFAEVPKDMETALHIPGKEFIQIKIGESQFGSSKAFKVGDELEITLESPKERAGKIN